MAKFLPATLMAATLLLATTPYPHPTLAMTCASKCGKPPLQFKPGQYIQLIVVNKTYSVVELERTPETEPISLEPGQELQLPHNERLQANLAILFWSEEGYALKMIASKPNLGKLRLEIYPSQIYPGDRSLYLREDGRVKVL
jgi:hypothetical protein